MTITSSYKADGEVAEITDYNKLRDDIVDTDGHKHDGTEGPKVNHGDLTDGVLSYLNHDKINKHVQGTGTGSDPDDTESGGGGDNGVHGLPVGVYVLGSRTDGAIMIWGTDTTDEITSVITGSEDKVDQTTSARKTYGITFASVPSVIVMSNDTDSARVGAYDVTTAGFYPRIGFPYGSKATSQHTTSYTWVAMGVPA